MDWLQYYVVVWMQFAIETTVILGLTWLALHWIEQPVERLRLILMVLMAIVALPWIIAFASVPSWRLGWIAADPSQPVEALPFNINSDFIMHKCLWNCRVFPKCSTRRIPLSLKQR